MADSIQLKVVTPLGSIYDQSVMSVSLRSLDGEFCFLPNHCPLLAAISTGPLIVEAKEGKEVFVVGQGFFEGNAYHANVVAKRCVKASNIDSSSLLKEQDALKQRLSALTSGDESYSTVFEDLTWTEACLAAVGHLSKITQ